MLIQNRYELRQKLGEGGMGVVYRALDHHTGQEVAVKNLRSTSTDPRSLERFTREAEALRRLNHPNIVKLLDMVQEGDASYLVMELVPGGALDSILNRHEQLPIRRVMLIALELADALARAHHLKIIHRDLKPSNVLLAEDGTPRLSDFGLARTDINQSIESDALVGTLAYLTPEALSGQNYDHRSDIWAFGVLLFEMLAGQHPFMEKPDSAAVLNAIINRPPLDLEALRPDAPTALVDLVYRMLTKNPAERIGSMRLVGAELEALLQGVGLGSSSQAQLKGSSASPTPVRLGRFDTPTGTTPLKNNLPAQTTAFVGRDLEIAELVRLLHQPTNRLITILGQGGMGKTRLAQEAARYLIAETRTQSRFVDGVYFVDLTPLSNPEHIVTALADAIAYPIQPDERPPLQQLVAYLQKKQLLLIVDNFEHLLEAAVTLDELLKHVPTLCLLVTSRERLNLQHETLFWLEGMELPAGDTPAEAARYAAVQLFIQSAQRLQPHLSADNTDLPAIVTICRLLQGMPLGILLAASWIEMLTPNEIAEEIKGNIDFLEYEMRDLAARHRSLRAVFNSSWQRLNTQERDTMLVLSVFRGGFSREAAQHASGSSLRTLTSLMNKSLLRRNPNSGRYDIHEMTRQYAYEQLENSQQTAQAHQAHSAYYLAWLQRLVGDVKGKRQLQALDEVERDFDNIRHAWQWAADQHDDAALAGGLETLLLFANMRSRQQEVGELVNYALARARPGTALYRRLLARSAYLHDLMNAAPQLEDCLAQAEAQLDLLEGAYCLSCLAYIAFLSGDPQRTATLYETSTHLYRQAGEMLYVVDNLVNVAFNYDQLGSPDHGSASLYEGLALSRQIGHKVGEAYCLGWLGTHTHFYLGDYAATEAYYQQALDLLTEMGQRAGIARAQAAVGQAAFYLANFPKARQLAQLGLQGALELNIGYEQGFALNTLGLLACLERTYPVSRQHFEASRRASSHPFLSIFVDWGMAVLHCGLRLYDTADEYLQVALKFSYGGHMTAAMTWLLPAAALLANHQHNPRQAAELLALAYTHAQSPVALFEAWSLFTDLRARLQQSLGAEAFAAAWQAGQALDLKQVIAALIR